MILVACLLANRNACFPPFLKPPPLPQNPSGGNDFLLSASTCAIPLSLGWCIKCDLLFHQRESSCRLSEWFHQRSESIRSESFVCFYHSIHFISFPNTGDSHSIKNGLELGLASFFLSLIPDKEQCQIWHRNPARE
jgi:hypothetical protein